jgi:hypothetical protein
MDEGKAARFSGLFGVLVYKSARALCITQAKRFTELQDRTWEVVLDVDLGLLLSGVEVANLKPDCQCLTQQPLYCSEIS